MCSLSVYYVVTTIFNIYFVNFTMALSKINKHFYLVLLSLKTVNRMLHTANNRNKNDAKNKRG